MFLQKIFGQRGNMESYNSNYLSNAKEAMKHQGVEINDDSKIQLFGNRGKVKYALVDVDGDGVFDKKVKVRNNRYTVKDLKPKRAERLAAQLEMQKNLAEVTLKDEKTVKKAAPEKEIPAEKAVTGKEEAIDNSPENAIDEKAAVPEKTEAKPEVDMSAAYKSELNELKATLKSLQDAAAKADKLANANAKTIEAKELCEKFHKAIDGAGTDYKPFKEVIESLNADNIAEVMNQWDKSQGKEYGETFMESFLNDAGHYQKRKLGTKILEALEARAEKSGVKLGEQPENIKKELESGWISNKKVNKNIAEVLNAINEKDFPELVKKDEKEAA